MDMGPRQLGDPEFCRTHALVAQEVVVADHHTHAPQAVVVPRPLCGLRLQGLPLRRRGGHVTGEAVRLGHMMQGLKPPEAAV